MSAAELVVGSGVALAGLLVAGRGAARARRAGDRLGRRARQQGRPAWPRLVRRPQRVAEPDVVRVVTEVAARLRAGATVEEAWQRATRRAAGRPGPDGAGGERAVGRASTAASWLAEVGVRTRDPRVRAQLAAVDAACRLADRLGAPLADVLERSADGVVEVARAEDAVRVALAGPASTARLLAWLPAAGVVLGWALGVDPVRTLLDGGPGSSAGVLGVVLAVLGRRWSHALVRGARRDGPRAQRGRPRQRADGPGA